MLECRLCAIPLTFKTKSNLNRHLQKFHSTSDGNVQCFHCGMKMARPNLRRHITTFHNFLNQNVRCYMCKIDFDSIEELILHQNNEHRNETEFEVTQNALNRQCTVLEKRFSSEAQRQSVTLNISSFFIKYGKEIQQELINQLIERNHMKVWLILVINFFKEEEGEIAEYDTFHFRTHVQRNEYNWNTILSHSDISDFMQRAENQLNNLVEDVMTKGSGWRVHSFSVCRLEVANCASLDGSCMLNKITVKQVSDIQRLQYDPESSKGQFQHGCFLYAIAAYFTKSQNYHVLDNFLTQNVILDGVKLPMKLSAIRNFEEKNQHLELKINVLQTRIVRVGDQKVIKIYPLRVLPTEEKKNIIYLLWMRFPDDDDEEEEDLEEEESEEEEEGMNIKECERFFGDITTKGHYFHIKDVSVFIKSNQRKKRYICCNCLSSFATLSTLQQHEKNCLKNKPQSVKIPKNDGYENVLRFKNFFKKFKCPFVAFYDFEAILTPKQNALCFTCQKNKSSFCHHKSKVVNEQIPSCFTFLLLDRDKKIIYKTSYLGENCLDEFMKTIFHVEKIIESIIQDKKPMYMSENDKVTFQTANACHICEKPFQHGVDGRIDKVRDHDNLTGNFIGASHAYCNLRRREDMKVPLFCHNAKNYDNHFLIRACRKSYGIKYFSALPESTEKFKIFTINNFVFLDSAAFLNCSLDQLAKDLNKNTNFPYTILDQIGFYQENELEKKKLLLQKGIYPYEYMTDFDKYKETDLPDKKYFFSQLSNSNISEEDYQHAKTVFFTFQCNNLRDYTQLYCVLDTVLLAEVIFQFREEIYTDLNLDICQYISLPQLSLDCALKKCKLEIELLTDIDQILLVEGNIRGGLSFINQRYATCDNESTGNCDTDKEIVLLDYNNLYGFSQSQLLPYKDYKWLTKEEIEKIDWKTINLETDKGYILEVDLDYPSHLHFSHADFPLAAETKEITFKDLSPYAKECLEKIENKEKYQSKKLLSTLCSKEKYVLHFSNLKLYLELGLKLKKIHRVLSFTQKAIFKDYIEYCTEKRRKSVSPFQGNIYKILSNSLFGKMLENVRNRLKCSFHSSSKRVLQKISDNNCDSFRILNEDLVVVFSKEMEISLNKPYPIGFTILERSKYFMSDFFLMFYRKLLKELQLV